MQRLRVLFVIGSLGFLLLGLAACAQVSGEETKRQLATASELAQNVGQLQQLLQETRGELSALEQRVAETEKQVSGFTAAGALALDRTADIPDPPSGKVALRISFQYQPQPLPGNGLRAYEPTPGVNSLWAMESLPAGQPLPVGKPLPDSTLFLEPGESRLVTLAYQNPTAEDIGFLVLPHQEWPGALARYVWPTCLCMSFVYQAPANGAWYRVIRLTVSPDIPPGSKVDALWTVLTDPSVFPAVPEATVSKATPTPAAEATDLVALGKALAARQGCLVCHSVDGSPRVGPTWKGLFGKEETLTDGSTVKVDEAYLRESIVDPDAKVVKGFPAGVMPQDFGQKLSDEEIQALIEYIKTLR